jgi:hypothetical protein
MSPSVWKATLGVSRENSQRFWESLSSVGVQLQTKSCRCCFVYDVWCVCYDKRGGNHCLLPSTRWRESQRVDLLESVESSLTPLLHRFSPIFLERRKKYLISSFFYLLSEDIRAPTWVNETLGCLCHGGCSHPHQNYITAMRIRKPAFGKGRRRRRW